MAATLRNAEIEARAKQAEAVQTLAAAAAANQTAARLVLEVQCHFVTLLFPCLTFVLQATALSVSLLAPSEVVVVHSIREQPLTAGVGNQHTDQQRDALDGLLAITQFEDGGTDEDTRFLLLADYTTATGCDLTCGMVVQVHEQNESGWWLASWANGGYSDWLPSSYLEICAPTTIESLDEDDPFQATNPFDDSSANPSSASRTNPVSTVSTPASRGYNVLTPTIPGPRFDAVAAGVSKRLFEHCIVEDEYIGIDDNIMYCTSLLPVLTKAMPFPSLSHFSWC